MKKSTTVLGLVLLFAAFSAFGQKEEKTKKGFSMGGVPVIAYDSDTGFKYGALAEFYDYGDGTIYPKYKHKWYVEWSQTTKGSGIMMLTYDREYLIPKIRVIAEAAYFTEQTLDFYGFNGFESAFKPELALVGDPAYSTRVFYKHDRRQLRLKADFQGDILGRKLRWLGGVTYLTNNIGSVDIDKLNKGVDAGDENFLPSLTTNPTLFDNYVAAGIIPADQADGGNHTLLKAGLVFDTRDNEPNPQTGIWTEAMLVAAPSFMSNTPYSFGRAALIHRQYFTIFKEKLSFAYRLDLQAKVFGDIPFYMLPVLYNSKEVGTGLGGSKNLRGVLRNRVVGDGMFYSNWELRWKVFKTVIFNQNFYLGANAFADAGMVIDKYEPFNSAVTLPTTGTKESLHGTYGAGIRLVLNQNFIIALDYGFALNKADGTSGMYIGLNYLF